MKTKYKVFKIKNTIYNRLQKNNSKIECCVLCKKETEYTFDIPVSERKYYIAGCGQLCFDCYRRLGFGNEYES